MPITLDHTAYQHPNAAIDANAISWDAVGRTDVCDDPYVKLIATVLIGGIPHHLEAYQVIEREVEPSIAAGQAREQGHAHWQSEQVWVPAIEMEAEAMTAAFPGDGAFETVAIEGRSYALFLSPHRT